MHKPTARQLTALRRRDPVLAAALRRVPAYPGFPQPDPTRPTHYHALVRAIVYQQLSGKAAATIHGRACALTSGDTFPLPHEVAQLDDAALRGAGLSRAKVASIRDLSARLLDGRLVLDDVGDLPDETIIGRLVDVRGIGVWSAQMFLLFRLGRLDVMADTDLGVREGARRLDGLAERPTPTALRARAECWRPLRSVATWVLWRLTELPER